MLQLDNPGLASGDPSALIEAIERADHPVTVWVGPAGATAYGFVGRLIDLADHAGAAPGARIGYLQQPVAGGPIET